MGVGFGERYGRLVAKAVIEIAKSGERDPTRLNERVIRALQERPIHGTRSANPASWTAQAR